MRSMRDRARAFLRTFGYELRRLKPPAPKPADLPNRRVATAFYRGRPFRCFLGDYLGESILTGAIWDQEVEQILDRLAPRLGRGHVIEVGANIGASMLPIASKYPQLTFHCIEPVPDFFRLLQENARLVGVENVELHNIAVGAVDGGPIELQVQEGTAGALALYHGHRFRERIPAVVRTLDSLFASMEVRFLKLDVDGFEWEVLGGARSIMERYHPPCFMEFAPDLMRRRGIEPRDVAGLFFGRGYACVTIYQAGLLLMSTASMAELLEAADAAPYYVDVLFEPTAEV
jgi:FkbM family methyltransferase